MPADGPTFGRLCRDMAKRPTPRKRPIQVQLDSKRWVAVGRYTLHECCDCGLVHEVQFRYNRRAKRFEERWIPQRTVKRRR